MSLVVAVISMALFLSDNDKTVVDKYSERKMAAKVLISGMRFNMYRRYRMRALESKDEEKIARAPTLQETIDLKDELWEHVNEYKTFRTGDSTASGTQPQ